MLPPILFIHAAFSQASHMAPWVRAFETAGFSCSAPSLPGHQPFDPKMLSSLSMHDYLPAILAVRESMTTPPIIIGHSIGGLLGQQLAAVTACSALVCIASVPPGILWAQLRALPHLARLLPEILAGRAIRPSDDTIRKMVLHDLPEPEQSEICASLGYDSGRVYRSLIFGLNSVPRGAIRCPVLCVSGDDDHVVSNRLSRSIARRYNADHIVIQKRGHWLIAPSALGVVVPRVLGWLHQKMPL